MRIEDFLRKHVPLSASDNPKRYIRQANSTKSMSSTATNGTLVGNITTSTGTTQAPYENSGDSPTPYSMFPLLLFALPQMWISSN
ncbi:hypothetical protein CHS0354_005545 [Potamilus streckersoni]|uniref:Uncharacterized protein n=1 Tax=Potamilus streckersoni TaxID=2493646 RepID=A0AAE0RNN6_9BIVA|nr:hypothetical protein CHS0354_005545 [Potamilus streckersoni]